MDGYNAVEVTCADGGVYCHMFPISVDVKANQGPMRVTVGERPPHVAHKNPVQVTVIVEMANAGGRVTYAYDSVTRIEFLLLNRVELRSNRRASNGTPEAASTSGFPPDAYGWGQPLPTRLPPPLVNARTGAVVPPPPPPE